MTATASGPLRPGEEAHLPGPTAAGSMTADVRTHGRLIGALFLAGFVTYGVGFALVSFVIDERDVPSAVSRHQTTLAVGAFLMLLTTAVDIGKAVLFFPLLDAYGRRTALTYLAAMVFEVALMAVGALSLLTLVPMAEQVETGVLSADLADSLSTLAVDVNAIAYQIGQAGLAFGAFFLCLLLFRARLAPRLLAVWGMLGYLLHFAGAAVELFGIHISLVLLVPGGLFEVAFGAWLLAGGLKLRGSARTA
jgi:hypothetical protein